MDITSFSDENFDTKEWVNKILQNADVQDKKESYTMSLVMKLQLYVQQVNAALEDTSQQVFMSLPKILRDTKNLQQEALSLQEKMSVVKEEIRQIEEDTGSSIASIEKLDKVKHQLEVAKQGLHESDNWTVLVNDLEEIFDSKDIDNITKKIVGMQKSLKLLVNIEDYEERKEQLEGLKNRLEAIASPFIVQAFTSNNIDQSIVYSKIFSSIDRLPQLLKYYHKCQKDVLVKKWRYQLEIEQDEPITQLIHNYYDVLLSNWHTQSKWLNQVFPSQSSVDSLIDIYIDVFASLDPSPSECVDAAIKQQIDKLGFLHEIKVIIKQFGNNIIEVINNMGGKTGIKKEKLTSLLELIYSPLVVYVSNYSVYEQHVLTQKLSQIKCIKVELPDTIQALGLTIPSVINLARDAKKRCDEITENCGYCGLLKALRVFLTNYADQYRVALRQIDRNKRGSGEEDWTNFQLCFSLLQNTGDVLMNLQKLEKDLTLAVLNFNKKDDSFPVEFKYLMLNQTERKEYESLVKCVTEGTKLSLLDHVMNEFNKLCTDIHNVTYQVVFGPISGYLNSVSSSKTWVQFDDPSFMVDLPDYSFSPQEYITQIGQYLITLPQHLEPFLFRENPSLECALKASDPEYINIEDVEGALADVFLKIIARGTCQSYCDQILTIFELTPAASRQLAHDINYLGDILKDFNLNLTENLKQLMSLLKIPVDQYLQQSAGYTARYVATIRQMRNIKSSG
ncbi:conserved oligomeric Golgi complex subunit 7 [Onthophagus taurus]|uniref:conserved oligomeric Golgi complex subunit 7 n=1 Tax=Onthophagus taurus TaxID=166361 RepID=UPI000C209667|nr:conserved oligomeric Golgi complex subunit 7 [Onthophagus taurus]